jgi:hypothetical protein
MRKLLSFLIALTAIVFGVCSPASAGCMALLGVGGSCGAPPPSGCSQATTFLARTSGLSGTETTAYTNLICGMVTDGTWSLIDALYIFATNSTTTANLNLISTSFGLTQHGTVTFTADQGYTGDGSTGYFDTGYTPSTAGGALTLNSGSFGLYNLTSSTANTNAVTGGVTDGAGNYLYMQPTTSGSFFYDVNAQNFPSTANTQHQGSWIITRTAVNVTQVYRNGSAFGAAGTGNSNALVTTPIFLLALNNNASPVLYTTDQLSAAYLGAGLNSTNAGLVSSRINAYMTALGINLY